MGDVSLFEYESRAPAAADTLIALLKELWPCLDPTLWPFSDCNPLLLVIPTVGGLLFAAAG